MMFHQRFLERSLRRMPMKKVKICLLSLLVLFVTTIAFSQGETGQINGTVTDPNGAVIPNATVTVRSVATGQTRSVQTDGEGFYQITNLLPGTYEVTVQSSGFEPVTRRVEVTVGGRITEFFQLGVKVEEVKVEVVAGGINEINTTDQQLSSVITGRLLTELPTITRNPYALVITVGNISEEDPTGRGVGVAINGQRAASTSVLLDGGENVDTFTATVGQSVPLDSVQEFRVTTSNFTAEYGRASGGIVNVATRQGTNEYRGNVYIFNRNSKFASNDFLNNARGIPRGNFNRNQWGYTFGGPIIRDKLFFFNATEWIRVRSTGTRRAVVPTSQLIAASNPNTRNFFSTYGQLKSNATVGRVFTVSDVIAILGIGSGAFASLPANMPAFQEVLYPGNLDQGAGTPLNAYQTVIRGDWNVSDKTQFYGRYAAEVLSTLPGTVGFSPYVGYDTTNEDLNNNFLLNLTHQFSANVVSQTKFTYNRLRNLQPLSDKPSSPTLYTFGFSSGRISDLSIAFPGYLPFSPGSAIPFGGPQSVYQLNQDVTYTFGKHTFKFGGQFIRINDNRTFGAFQNAVAILGPAGNYTVALNNFVNGILFQFQAAVDPQGKFPGQTLNLPVGQPNFSRQNRYNEFAFYAQDSWRVTPRLTLNLGLRYEYYGPQRNKDRNLDSNFYFGSGNNIFERIRNGSVRIAPQSPIGGLWKADKNNFAPRLGFAWDIFGDGRTSIRGGYGIAYERNFGNVTFNVIQNPPNYAVISVTAADIGAPIPITTSNSGPLSGSSGSVILPRTSLRHVREDIETAYAHFWSLAVERQVLRNTTASLEYSGSAGRKLYTLENINRLGSGVVFLGSTVSCPPFAPTSRLSCLYTNINTRQNNGFSNYHGLTASLESANLFDLGLTLTARYTYSVAKDNLSSTFSESANNFNLGLLDPFNPALDYGYADFDVRHRFVSSYVWDIPFFSKLQNKTLKAIFDGFALSGIVRVQSGSPFTVFDCQSAIATVCIRLVPSGPVNFGHPGRMVPYTEPGSFVYTDLRNQTPYTFPSSASPFAPENGPFPAEMTRRNSFRGPGQWNADMGLYKNISFGERYKLQLRVEAYNVFNHANLFVDVGRAEVAEGVIPAFKSGRRNVQFAAKFSF